MAKKNYTPEEMQAKMAKKSDNCKIFFGTFTKALAVFLAVVIAWSLVAIAYTAPSMGGTVVAGTATNNGGSTNTDNNTGSTDAPITEDENLLGGDETTDVPAGDETTDAPAGDETTDAPAGNDAPAAFSKANAHEMLNKWTAAPSKGSYKFTRVSDYTPDGAIDVGNATGTLNKVIQMVDKNASLDSVVGGFLGIGNKGNEVKNGKLPEGMNAQYALKAMSLTAADVKSATANGNKYTVVISDCSNPQKDGKNALSRATNDFFTHQEVVDGIASTAGSLIKVESTDVQYTGITITATVDGDVLKTLNISYTFSAKLSLKALGVGINGKGKATNSITYTIL